MDNDSQEDIGFTYTSEDVRHPLQWIERLSSQSLQQWLRFALWVRDPLPVVVPPSSMLALEIIGVINKGSNELITRIRAIIPVMLQEWGRKEPSNTLDDLLIISGKLRCAAAEHVILQIANERLYGRADEIPLRQRCLSVLSGFGCTDKSQYIFKKYLHDIEYIAICYRALYRFDFAYAGTELSLLYEIFNQEGATDELRIILGTLLRDLSTPAERFEMLLIFLKKSDPESFPEVLQTLIDVNLLNIDLFHQAEYSQRVDLFRLLLERSRLNDLKDILWAFMSVGIELHFTQAHDDKEYLQVVYGASDPDSRRSERLFTTERFSDLLIIVISECIEPIAAVGVATIPEGWELS
jgi:hypothetical protein